MSTTATRTSHGQRVSCVACKQHMRPEMVPWLQHAIGCPVRTAELSRQSDSRSVYAAWRESLRPSS
jgi:hypothetical protein